MRIPSVLGILACVVMILGGPTRGSAQAGDFLLVSGPDGSSVSLTVQRSRGYATVPHEALRQLGWGVEVDVPRVRARLGPDGPLVEFSLGSPLVRWGEDLLQMVSAPFSGDGSVQIPLQFVVDFLPAHASEAYAFSPDDNVLQILDASLLRERPTAARQGSGTGYVAPSVAADRTDIAGRSEAGRDRLSGAGPSGARAVGVGAAGAGAVEAGAAGADSPLDERAATNDPSETFRSPEGAEKRVVVIDPGHGGSDPGTTGRGGRREKDIALTIGRYLERELRGDEDLEVYMTRDRDVLVPLWERGPQAMQWKGDRFGVFISIHVNSSPSSPAIRGFETYFLSEARTEHERRVAAMENAPLELEAELDGADVEEDLNLITRELRILDHQHWSSLLAEGIQFELEAVHPGPNRGVKQGPFAVITNALMPAVLVEVGFISNREEERVLSRAEFQRGVARALAKGVRDFFERYPPGQGVAAQGAPR